MEHRVKDAKDADARDHCLEYLATPDDNEIDEYPLRVGYDRQS